MKLELIELLGDGMFADVWRARDELDREVAVKIVREASVGVADALAHAKALARATHPNVVAVLTLENIKDPTTGNNASCVVMELIDGETLGTHLSRGKLTSAQVVLFGLGIIDGLAHIHEQGMAHGDLHVENVMIGASNAKIIDILYLNSLATLTSENRTSRLNRDILSLRLMLQELIVNSDIDSAEATEFNNMLGARAQLTDIRAAFKKITSPSDPEREQRTLDHLFSRVVDTDFVLGEPYAAALGEDTPDHAVYDLLERIASELVYDYKHSNYVKILWSRLSAAKRSDFLTHLGSIIDKETPKGKWTANLRLLSNLPIANWSGLRKVVQIRLEEFITKDVLAGHVDIHSDKKISNGQLGTYAINFWSAFQNKGILADNLISLLRQSWYTQNYVGSYFMATIPALAIATGRRTEFINAFRTAMSNDARIVKNKIEELPADWVAEIRA